MVGPSAPTGSIAPSGQPTYVDSAWVPIDPELKEQIYTDVNYRLKGGGSAGDRVGEIFCGRVRARKAYDVGHLRSSAGSGVT
jgi:hypothetical protein